MTGSSLWEEICNSQNEIENQISDFGSEKGANRLKPEITNIDPNTCSSG